MNRKLSDKEKEELKNFGRAFGSMKVGGHISFWQLLKLGAQKAWEVSMRTKEQEKDEKG